VSLVLLVMTCLNEGPADLLIAVNRARSNAENVTSTRQTTVSARVGLASSGGNEQQRERRGCQAVMNQSEMGSGGQEWLTTSLRWHLR
jgi:hypothetical protein